MYKFFHHLILFVTKSSYSINVVIIKKKPKVKIAWVIFEMRVNCFPKGFEINFLTRILGL